MKAIIESASGHNGRTITQRVGALRLLAAFLATLTLTFSASAAEEVPFKGRSAGIITSQFDPVENVVELHITGEGVATHVGHFTWNATREIFLDTGTSRHTGILTAADGDMLVLIGIGGGAIDATHAEGTFTVAGGTGRFEGATGSIHVIITFEIAPPTFEPDPYTSVLEGTILLSHE